MNVKDDELSITKINNDLTLEELLSLVNDDNRHEEITTEPPVGKEIW